MQPSQLGEYEHRIKQLQRADLDEQELRVPAAEIERACRAADLPCNVWLAEIEGIPRTATPVGSHDEGDAYLTRDILAGLNGQGLPAYFVLFGQPNGVRIIVGTLQNDEAAGASLQSMFTSQYPGLTFKRRHDDEAASTAAELANPEQDLRAFLGGCECMGVVTGVPTPNLGSDGGAGTQIDRLIRGLCETPGWALVVMADPVKDETLAEMQLRSMQERIGVEQEEGLREWRERAAQSLPSHYLQLLELRRQFLEACLYEGGWLVQSYVCAKDQLTYQRARALVKSIYSGDHSRLERIRVLDCHGASGAAASLKPITERLAPLASGNHVAGMQPTFKYHTVVSSSQLSALIHLPRSEAPGYYVRDVTSFDVSSHLAVPGDSLAIGEILDRGRKTHNPYRVLLNDLTRHSLVVGLTGSGKTKTIQHLLRQLQSLPRPVNFLVIEPAKREYRNLSSQLPAGRPPLRVFTLGEGSDQAAPFRLNPFEIRPGASVQSHIDGLKAVFNASFGMWAPLPQVMERAIHELYEDKGWDTVRSVNERAAISKNGAAAWHPRAQPTLTDLHQKVSELVPKLGYDDEVERNVKTALETRINSLRIGAKGLMLDTPESIPIESLLEAPTVLELEAVGDDEEKAFIMGLVLMALYEYHRGTTRGEQQRLRHVTVVEEAHRLLANAPATSDPMTTNLRGKAVETFVNMLSEVRAYGEGFIIAEQIATKLATDVVKNTALKIMHRTVSNDDRQVMGGAMNLDTQQLRQVVSLGLGEAVVHGGGRWGDDNPMLVAAPPPPDAKPMTDAEVRQRWEEWTRAHRDLRALFLPYRTCERHCSASTAACLDARRIAEEPAVVEAFAAFLTTLAAGSLSRETAELPLLFRWLYGGLMKAMTPFFSGNRQQAAIAHCCVTHALYRQLERCGTQYRWSYERTEQLAAMLLPVLAAAAGHDTDAVALQKFCTEYRDSHVLAYEPFYGCRQTCGEMPRCLYRVGIARLTDDVVLDDQFLSAGPVADELYGVCRDAAERALAIPDDDDDVPGTVMDKRCFENAALCFLIQKTHGDVGRWPVLNRRNAIKILLERFGRRNNRKEATDGEQRSEETQRPA